MKISGYSDQGLVVEDLFHAELSEITLAVTSDEARRIAEFLHLAANQMDLMGDSFDHLHLSDLQPEFESSPHFVVFNAAKLSGS